MGLPFHSRYVFHGLVSTLRPAVIADVGSCDGQQARRFKRQRPSARVVAFEANPRNFARMVADRRHPELGVEVLNRAAADGTGEATFFILEERADMPWATGASSLNQRVPESTQGLSETPVTVETVRLDEYFIDCQGPIALWIDVEGAAGRVVEGMAGIADRVCAVHIELETSPDLWQGQPAEGDVLSRLEKLGFKVLGSDQDWPGQRNVVLVRQDQTRVQRAATAAAAMAASLYGAAKRVSQKMSSRR